MASAISNSAITIDADQVQHVTPEGQTFHMSLSDVLRLAQSQLLEDYTGVLPSDVRCVFRRGKFTIWVGQHLPCVRTLNWITDDSPAQFGPGTTYSMRSIAMPYIIVVAAFDNGVLSMANECFFTLAPLTSTSDDLFYPALLNVSQFPEQSKKPLAWICTQHLDTRPIRRERHPLMRMHIGWQLLGECLFSASFNRSSEMHEGASYYELSRRVDDRIGTIDRWEAETRDNPLFILEVPFLKTGYTLEQVAERIFDNLGAARRDPSSDDLARLLINHAANPRSPS